MSKNTEACGAPWLKSTTLIRPLRSATKTRPVSPGGDAIATGSSKRTAPKASTNPKPDTGISAGIWIVVLGTLDIPT